MKEWETPTKAVHKARERIGLPTSKAENKPDDVRIKNLIKTS